MSNTPTANETNFTFEHVTSSETIRGYRDKAKKLGKELDYRIVQMEEESIRSFIELANNDLYDAGLSIVNLERAILNPEATTEQRQAGLNAIGDRYQTLSRLEKYTAYLEERHSKALVKLVKTTQRD